MNNDNKRQLILWAVCGIFFITVLMVSVAGTPPIFPLKHADTTVTTTDGESLGKVNINTASKEELMTLSGIGEVIADRILVYRQEHGPFETVEALLNINGIGEKTLEALREFIVV